MRDRVRESAIASLLASKRFVVSACAALAMVLGAVSAGASIFTGTPAEAEPQTPVQAIFTETTDTPPISNESPLLTKRQTLASQTIVVQPPLYTADTSSTKGGKGLNLRLSQEAAKATNALFYNPEIEADEESELSPEPASPAAPLEPTTTPSPQTPTDPPLGDIPGEPTGLPPETTDNPPPVDPTTEPALNSASSPDPTDTKPQ